MGPVGDFLDKDIQRFNRLIEQTLWPLGGIYIPRFTALF